MRTVPRATYRLQLDASLDETTGQARFGFDAAAQVTEYLHQLGVSHVYCSPYLQAAPGSQHGYDVVDHHKVNEELGGAEAHGRFCKEAGRNDLGQILDIVPNHMAIGDPRNRLWWDVLENGRASRYASYFDIDWQSPEEKLRGKVLIPILGDHYGRVLARGEIKIVRQGADFETKYFAHTLPIAPESIAALIALVAQQSGSDYLAFLADSLLRLPTVTDDNSIGLAERHRDKEVIHNLISRLCNEVPFIAEAIDSELDRFNRDADALDSLLERQHYRLAYWRTADQELGYRRFFDVNTLVGLRMEDPHVFTDTHAMITTWLRDGVLDGVRIDHPDGLRDPHQYFARLREAAPEALIVAEKILEPGENFRSDWPIDGTTGYEYLNEVAGLFVDREQEQEFSKVYTDFTGESIDYAEACHTKKHLVMHELLGSDINRLTSLFVRICESHRDRRDFTRHDIRHAIRELVSCFPIYRTYVVPDRKEQTDADYCYVSEAVEAATKYRPDLDPQLFEFLADVLMGRISGKLENEFVMRFQQFTPPVMAKGVEDTVFYNFNRLISLNEVGGDPGRFGVLPDSFYDFCAEIHRTHPRTMLTTSTHDTKRSEDVRSRIALLSEIPGRWDRALRRWATNNEKFKTQNRPDRTTEYFLYQTMLGAWPIGPDRLLPYIEKATREAKQQTSWLDPNEQFESATKHFIECIYGDETFMSNLQRFVDELVEPGRISSLSQLLLKLTSPGIPDLYQGTELWDLSLVDPDNRRKVDYDLRRRLLAELPQLTAEQILQRSDEGLPKLWTTHRTLTTRRDYARSLSPEGSSYQPLIAEGAKAAHLVGYLRGPRANGSDASAPDVAVLAPRLVMQLNNLWANTTVDLPAGSWRNQFTGDHITGGQVRLRDLFSRFPVALLVRE